MIKNKLFPKKLFSSFLAIVACNILAADTPLAAPADPTTNILTGMQLYKGWNMVSSPINGKKINLSMLKANNSSVGVVYGYLPGANYYNASYMEPGNGYWMKLTADANLNIMESYAEKAPTVTMLGIYSGAAEDAWNLLGTSTATSISELKSFGATSVYPFDTVGNQYSTSDAIAAGSGFWLKKPKTKSTVTTATGTDTNSTSTGNSSTSGSTAPGAKMTFMVYIVGSDLESNGGFATANLKQMMSVGSSKDVNVIAITGGAKKDGWQSLKRYKINQGSMQLIDDIGNVNMANPQTLSDFLVWGETNYPADKYVLSLWDHGGATAGYGLDENFGSMLSVPDITKALDDAYTKTSKSFELIGYDACLMATAEVANNTKKYAKYLAASEETEPGHGWDYAPILQAMTQNPTIDGASLGKVIADGFYATATTAGTVDGITFSIMDLSKIDNLMSAIDTFSQSETNALSSAGNIERLKIAKGRAKAEDYGNSATSSTDMVDIVDFANKLNSSAAANLANAVKQTVIYNVKGNNKPNANGMTIYMPSKQLKTGVDLTSYQQISFVKSYNDMLASYVALASTDTSAPDMSAISTSTDSSGGKSISTSVSQSSMDDIAEVYTILAKQTSDSTVYLILGTLSNSVDDNGTIDEVYDGKWLTLNGNFMSIYSEGKESDGAGGYVETFSIPAKVNGVEATIIAATKDGGATYKIEGAYLSSATEASSKNTLKLKIGDTITPINTYYYKKKDEFKEADGQSFTLTAAPALARTAVDASQPYYLAFELIDYSENESVSDFYQITGSSTPTQSGKSIRSVSGKYLRKLKR